MAVSALNRNTPVTDSNAGQDQARTQLNAAVTKPQDPRAAEVARKIDAVVQRNFGGDYKKAFQHYAGANGQVNNDGLHRLLGDAGIGSDTDIPFIGKTRDAYANGLMDAFDKNKDRNISWAEFTGGMAANGVNIKN